MTRKTTLDVTVSLSPGVALAVSQLKALEARLRAARSALDELDYELDQAHLAGRDLAQSIADSIAASEPKRPKRPRKVAPANTK